MYIRATEGNIQMTKNRFIGLGKIKMFVYSCILACLIEFLL